jgi:hypothetical protein
VDILVHLVVRVVRQAELKALTMTEIDLPIPCSYRAFNTQTQRSHNMTGLTEFLRRSLEERSPRMVGRLTEGYLDHHRLAMARLAICINTKLFINYCLLLACLLPEP